MTKPSSAGSIEHLFVRRKIHNIFAILPWRPMSRIRGSEAQALILPCTRMLRGLLHSRRHTDDELSRVERLATNEGTGDYGNPAVTAP